jgi:predicted metal-dependent phosphoesterase TrpH
VPAVELSVNVDDNDIHLLGYLFEPNDRNIHTALDEFRQRRNQRAQLMVAKLDKLNIGITMEDVLLAAGGGAIGRPHVADALVKSGNVQSYEEAFYKYLRTGAPAYVPKENFAPGEAIELIHRAGGIIVLAHPGLNEAVRYLERLVELGLDGIEVLHPVHSPQDLVRFGHLAERFRLVSTGGSDYHGRFEASKHGDIGSQNVPAGWLEQMKQRAQTIRGAN